MFGPVPCLWQLEGIIYGKSEPFKPEWYHLYSREQDRFSNSTASTVRTLTVKNYRAAIVLSRFKRGE